MIGIRCRGHEHFKRVVAAVEKLTPEVYMLLFQAKGLVSRCAAAMPDEQAVDERGFAERVDKLLNLKPEPEDSGDIEMVWFDFEYTGQDGKPI
jgi:hypothetical protein